MTPTTPAKSPASTSATEFDRPRAVCARVLVLARLSWAEGFRQGGLRPALAVLIALVLLLPWTTHFGLGREFALIREMIVDSAMLAGAVVAVLLAATLAERERHSKTLLVWLSKPVRPGEVLVGRTLGVWAVLAAAFMVIALASSATLWWAQFETRRSEQQLGAAAFLARELWPLWQALFLAGTRAAVLAAVLSAAAPALRPAATALLGLALFCLGHLNHTLLAPLLGSESPAAALTGRALRAVLPNFAMTDVRELLAAGEPIPPALLGVGALYALLYSALALLVGARWFAARDRG